MKEGGEGDYIAAVMRTSLPSGSTFFSGAAEEDGGEERMKE
jgi:hypothetical protein